MENTSGRRFSGGWLPPDNALVVPEGAGAGGAFALGGLRDRGAFPGGGGGGG